MYQWETENNLIVKEDRGVIQVIHIQELQPYNITSNYDNEVMNKFSLTDIQPSFKEQILNSSFYKGFYDAKNRLITLEEPVASDRHNLYIRLQLYNGSSDQSAKYDSALYIYKFDALDNIINRFLVPIDYLDYTKKLDSYSNNLSLSTRNLSKNLTQVREDLRAKTSQSQNTTDIINNLELYKTQLDNKEEIIKNLTQDIDSVEQFYTIRKNQIESLPYQRRSEYLLFESETDDYLSALSARIAKTKSQLDSIRRDMDGIWAIYYNEIDAARAKENTTNANYALLITVLAILVSLLSNQKGAIFNRDILNWFLDWKKLSVLSILAFLALNQVFKLYTTPLSVLLAFVLIFVMWLVLNALVRSYPEEKNEIKIIAMVISLVFLFSILVSWEILNKVGLPIEILAPFTFIVTVGILVLMLTEKSEFSSVPLNNVNKKVGEKIEKKQEGEKDVIRQNKPSLAGLNLEESPDLLTKSTRYITNLFKKDKKGRKTRK